MASPNFTINGSSCPPEKAVAYGATVTLALLSTSGVNTIAWSIVGTDRTSTPIPVITPAGSPPGATATFTMVPDPLTGFGASLLVQCVVNGGRDSAGQVDPSLTKTAIAGVANTAGIVPLSVGEQFERDASHGWTAAVNTALASVGTPGVNGAGILAPVDAVSTSNITQAGTTSVDGVTMTAGVSRVLCVGQTTTTQNGIKLVQSGAWTNPSDFNSNAQVIPGQIVYVKPGGVHGDATWYLQSGTTIAGAKVYAKSIVQNAVYYVPAPTGVAATDGANWDAACAYAIATPGVTLHGSPHPTLDYVIDHDLILDHANSITVKFPCGAGKYAAGGRMYRTGVSVATKLLTGFTQPALNGTFAMNVATAGIAAGKHVYIVVAGVPGYYLVLSITDSTHMQVQSLGPMVATTTVAAGLLTRTSDAIFQARSATKCTFSAFTAVFASPYFAGRGINLDNILGSDCDHNTIEHFVGQAVNFSGAAPALVASGASPPADTLTGTMSANCGIKLRIEWMSTTQYRYSTNYDIYGNPDWEETGLLASGGAHALQGSATGLTYTPVNVSHPTDSVYTADVGATIVYVNGFDNLIDNGNVGYCYDGAHAIGVGNKVIRVDTLAATVGGACARMNGNDVHVDVTPEPGPSAGRGVVVLDNCLGANVRCGSGDLSTTGAWVVVNGGSGIYINGAMSVNNSATGAAAASISSRGCQSLRVDGQYSNPGPIVSFDGTSTSGVVSFGPVSWPGTVATAQNDGGITVANGSGATQINFELNGKTLQTNSYLRGLPYVETGLNFRQLTGALANGNNNNVALNCLTIELSGWTAAATITGIQWSNLGEGARVLLTWDASLFPLTITHEDTNSSATNRILTETGAPVTIRGGYVELIHDVLVSRWRLIGHSPAVAQINPQTGTTYTLAATDANRLVKCANAAAITVTVPQDIFAQGETVPVMQSGAGQVTLSAVTGVSLINAKSNKTRVQNSVLNVTCLDPTHGAAIFLVSGDMA